LSARAFECVNSTGFLETEQASSVVWSPECETSTAMPTAFIFSTIDTPKSLRPPFVRSVEPSPILLRAL
jgi:hypothetical protein